MGDSTHVRFRLSDQAVFVGPSGEVHEEFSPPPDITHHPSRHVQLRRDMS